MSTTVVKFPEGGAYPSAPLCKKDERALALLRRSLAAARALQSAYARKGDCDVEDCSPEVQREFERLHEATHKPEAELAELADQDEGLADWFEYYIGQAILNARRERRAGRS
jgi:hypothetical protein